MKKAASNQRLFGFPQTLSFLRLFQLGHRNRGEGGHLSTNCNFAGSRDQIDETPLLWVSVFEFYKIKLFFSFFFSFSGQQFFIYFFRFFGWLEMLWRMWPKSWILLMPTMTSPGQSRARRTLPSIPLGWMSRINDSGISLQLVAHWATCEGVQFSIPARSKRKEKEKGKRKKEKGKRKKEKGKRKKEKRNRNRNKE